MRIDEFSFGCVRIDGVRYECDLVIDRGDVRKRKKKASKTYRDEFGHTPLSVDEKIPLDCRRLIVGTGVHGALPVMDAVKREARSRKVVLVVAPTAQAIAEFLRDPDGANAILHLTC